MFDIFCIKIKCSFPRLKLWIAVSEILGPDSWKKHMEQIRFFIGMSLSGIYDYTKKQLKPSDDLFSLEEYYSFLANAGDN